MPLYELNGVRPEFAASGRGFVAPDAALIGTLEAKVLSSRPSEARAGIVSWDSPVTVPARARVRSRGRDDDGRE